MKIKDLLYWITNKEPLPKIIKVNCRLFYLIKKETINGSFDYQDDNGEYLIDFLTEYYYLSEILDREFEIVNDDNKIIEEDKKINTYEQIMKLKNAINKIGMPLKEAEENWGKYTKQLKQLNQFEEDKKIEKIDIGKMLQTKKWKRDKKTYQTINELIDEVNKLKEE